MINGSPKMRLCNAIDSMLWNMYAYRLKPPTAEELAEYDRICKHYIDNLIENVKNEDRHLQAFDHFSLRYGVGISLDGMSFFSSST